MDMGQYGLQECHENATCADTEESYTCICNKGFEGDGFDCKEEGKYLIGQKFLVGQNFRHQVEISTILSDEFLSDKVPFSTTLIHKC